MSDQTSGGYVCQNCGVTWKGSHSCMTGYPPAPFVPESIDATARTLIAALQQDAHDLRRRITALEVAKQAPSERTQLDNMTEMASRFWKLTEERNEWKARAEKAEAEDKQHRRLHEIFKTIEKQRDDALGTVKSMLMAHTAAEERMKEMAKVVGASRALLHAIESIDGHMRVITTFDPIALRNALNALDEKKP